MVTHTAPTSTTQSMQCTQAFPVGSGEFTYLASVEGFIHTLTKCLYSHPTGLDMVGGTVEHWSRVREIVDSNLGGVKPMTY